MDISRRELAEKLSGHVPDPWHVVEMVFAEIRAERLEAALAAKGAGT